MSVWTAAGLLEVACSPKAPLLRIWPPSKSVFFHPHDVHLPTPHSFAKNPIMFSECVWYCSEIPPVLSNVVVFFCIMITCTCIIIYTPLHIIIFIQYFSAFMYVNCCHIIFCLH